MNVEASLKKFDSAGMVKFFRVGSRVPPWDLDASNDVLPFTTSVTGCLPRRYHPLDALIRKKPDERDRDV